MDQIKTGKFIADTRKELSMTQRGLADALGISDKTVSKWECGNGMPEVGLMLPLCNTLGISVNELLSGERLGDEYKQRAEQNLVELIGRTRHRKLGLIRTALLLAAALVITFVVCGIAFISSNIFNWGDSPTPLTTLYLAAAFAGVFTVSALLLYGLSVKDGRYILWTVGAACAVCTAVFILYKKPWLLLLAAAGLCVCAGFAASKLVQKSKENRSYKQ